MNELIEGVLEISKSDKIDYEIFKSINLNQALQKSISNFNQEIGYRNAEINTSQLPHYKCREADFFLVFQNLIQNGIKYNKSTIPIIEIESKILNDNLYIKFTDNGIGLITNFKIRFLNF